MLWMLNKFSENKLSSRLHMIYLLICTFDLSDLKLLSLKISCFARNLSNFVNTDVDWFSVADYASNRNKKCLRKNTIKTKTRNLQLRPLWLAWK